MISRVSCGVHWVYAALVGDWGCGGVVLAYVILGNRELIKTKVSLVQDFSVCLFVWSVFSKSTCLN